MTQSGEFGERRLRPLVFLAHNPISLIGIGLTTASALTLIGFWVVAVFGHGGSANPYVGIIFDLCLPALFVLGLLPHSHRYLVEEAKPKGDGAASN